MLGVLNVDKDLGRSWRERLEVCVCVCVCVCVWHMNDEFCSLKVTFEESSISPVVVSHYLLQCTTYATHIKAVVICYLTFRYTSTCVVTQIYNDFLNAFQKCKMFLQNFALAVC